MSKIISFSSVRHGSGKSTLASILALELSKRKKRVLVIDNNFKYPSIHRLLMAEYKYTVDDMKPFLFSTVIDEAIFREHLSSVNDYLDVLVGSRMFLGDNTMSADNISSIAEICESAYDYILIDLKNGFESQETVSILENSDKVFLVTPYDINAKGYLGLALASIKPEHREMAESVVKSSTLIINNYAENTGPLPEKMAEDFGVSEYLILPHSPDVLAFANGYVFSPRDEALEFTSRFTNSVYPEDERQMDDAYRISQKSKINGKIFGIFQNIRSDFSE